MLLLTAQTIPPGSSSGQGQDIETNLKAAFLYNFTRYVDWPDNGEQTEFVIGIVGPSDLDDALKEIARSSEIGNKKIVIRHFDKLEQIEPCQLLFVARRSKMKLAEVLARAGKNELTVGEEPGAARSGTIFDFIRVGDKLRFEVNMKALESSGLRISSQLLRLAIVVG
jgi:hypothetical protein